MIFLLVGKTFMELEFFFFPPPYRNAVNGKSNHESRKERPQKRGGGGRFEPYGNPNKRYRVFVSNIPYDVKWQTLKDLMKEKVGEVTYVEHLMDGEGKSRVSFRTEELMKKAVEKVNKHVMNGRPLKVKEDPDGVIAQRMGMGPGPGGPSMVNIPPSLMNNPNIPNEIIHGLQAGKIGSTIFVANLDYKVGWKKLKEVFGMAGVVVRSDILEDKDGKSRGMGTVTFEMPLEAVQAVSMFNGQLLFNRVMHVKLLASFFSKPVPPSYAGGLSGVGLGLGPGGQPIDATQLNRGNSMGMDRMNSGMDRLGGGGMDRMGGLDRMGMDRMDRMSDLDRLGSGFDRMGSGLDRLGPSMDRLGSGLDRMSSSVDRMGPGGFDRLGPSGMDRMSGGMDFASPMGIDRMNTGLDRMGSNFDRMGSGGGPGAGGANARKGCQIFVRNVRHFQFIISCAYADIKMENGKSKGCGVVRFDSPETAERACRTMNGYRLSGREIDVRIDRNA
uniref:RRM domain-containing protein n=1 Tax=Sinocyclocheilus anshuiensis TaxID=1608454 RepID=A0A671P741_9TELE